MSDSDLIAKVEKLVVVARAARDLLLAWPKPGQEVHIPAHRVKQLAKALLDIDLGIDTEFGDATAIR